MRDGDRKLTPGEIVRMALFVLLLISVVSLVVLALFPPDIIFGWP